MYNLHLTDLTWHEKEILLVALGVWENIWENKCRYNEESFRYKEKLSFEDERIDENNVQYWRAERQKVIDLREKIVEQIGGE